MCASEEGKSVPADKGGRVEEGLKQIRVAWRAATGGSFVASASMCFARRLGGAGREAVSFTWRVWSLPSFRAQKGE